MPKQINVLVSAVDSGVNITDYATPGPWRKSTCFGQNALLQLLITIFTARSLKGRAAGGVAFGGDGDDLKRGEPPVNHVNIIAQQAQPNHALNERGEGS